MEKKPSKRVAPSKIVVLGSTNTDMVISGRKIPVPGETVSGGTFRMTPGGKGANQAVAVARLSAKKGSCIFIAKVGDDLFGRDTARRMKREGIDARLAVDAHEASGTALILVGKDGQNVISVALGANGTLSVSDIEPHRKDIESAAALLMQLETPVPALAAAAKWAHDAGATVILNPAPAAKLPGRLLRCVDWLTPNETEAEILTGVKVVDADSAAKAAAALKRQGVRHVIITMGSKGAYSDDCRRLFPARKAKAVDCVAAGDTFSGAIAVALAEGRTCEEAIRFAQAASAISVTRPGAQSSVPFRREVESVALR